MVKIGKLISRIHIPKLLGAVATVASSGALAAAFPQYAVPIAIGGAVVNTFVNPVRPAEPSGKK